MTNSNVRIADLDYSVKNITTNITTKATAYRGTPSTRATKFGEEVETTNVRNDEGVATANDMKDKLGEDV